MHVFSGQAQQFISHRVVTAFSYIVSCRAYEVVDMLCRGDITPAPYEQEDVSIALKITPTSNLFRRTDSIVCRLLAIILRGDFRGLEVTLTIHPENPLSIAPMVPSKGTKKSMQKAAHRSRGQNRNPVTL